MVPSVHIIGCGLIGTSIALSLRKSGYKVSAEDINADHVAQAQDLGVSATLSRQQPVAKSDRHPEVVFVCVPPGVAAESIKVGGNEYKAYFGSASAQNKGHNNHTEGILRNISSSGMTYEDRLKEIKQDLQSSISYAGGRDLACLKKVGYHLA